MHHGLSKIKPYLSDDEYAELVPLVDQAEQQAMQIVELRRLIAEGASLAEVAEALKCSPSTVQQIERTALRKCLNELRAAGTTI